MAAEYRPWRLLRDHPEIVVERADLPSGLDGVLAEASDGVAAIIVDRGLLRPERDAAIWHEFFHWLRGGSGWRPGLPDHLRAIVDKEERTCDRLVARAMVPDERLDALRGRPDPVTVVEAAEELEVPVGVLLRRLAG